MEFVPGYILRILYELRARKTTENFLKSTILVLWRRRCRDLMKVTATIRQCDPEKI